MMMMSMCICMSVSIRVGTTLNMGISTGVYIAQGASIQMAHGHGGELYA